MTLYDKIELCNHFKSIGTPGLKLKEQQIGRCDQNKDGRGADKRAKLLDNCHLWLLYLRLRFWGE